MGSALGTAELAEVARPYAGGGGGGAEDTERSTPEAGWVRRLFLPAIYADLDPPLPPAGPEPDPFSSYPDLGFSTQNRSSGFFSPNTWNLTHST